MERDFCILKHPAPNGHGEVYFLRSRIYNDLVMFRQRGSFSQSVVLYDAGGWFLIGIFTGVAFIGVLLDYLWNYLVFSVTLRWQRLDIPVKKKQIYCVIITALGLLIDWLYYELTWGVLSIGGLSAPVVFPQPGTQPGWEIITILVPLLLIGAVNGYASRRYLKIGSRPAVVVGTMMGVFTAPWLIVAAVLLGW